MKLDIKRFGLTHNPQKEKRQSNKIVRQTIIFLCVFVLIAFVITAIIAKLIQSHIVSFSVGNEMDSLWIGSFASYLGGTIGGIFSGAFAFLGVFYTIKYYKNSDDKKEKSAIQPFLLVTAGADKTPHKGFTVVSQNDSDNTKKDVNITIKNIGNGFASILVLHTGFNIGGFAYNKVLCTGESDYVFLKVDSKALENGIEIGIQYIDAMRNEYVQIYTIKSVKEHIDIECGYPKWIEQR
ncbi:MAG: hypothetical protein IJD09_00515 [Clostridia bacterium]|nr:hypothetical protein [Clostridia bacterium]